MDGVDIVDCVDTVDAAREPGESAAKDAGGHKARPYDGDWRLGL